LKQVNFSVRPSLTKRALLLSYWALRLGTNYDHIYLSFVTEIQLSTVTRPVKVMTSRH